MQNQNKQGSYNSPKNIYSKVSLIQSPKFVKRPEHLKQNKVNTLVSSDPKQQEAEPSPIDSNSQSINVCADDKTSKSFISRQATPPPLETMLGSKAAHDFTFTPRFTDNVNGFFEKYQKVSSPQNKVVSDPEILRIKDDCFVDQPIELGAQDLFPRQDEQKSEIHEAKSALQEEEPDAISQIRAKSSVGFAFSKNDSLDIGSTPVHEIKDYQIDSDQINQQKIANQNNEQEWIIKNEDPTKDPLNVTAEQEKSNEQVVESFKAKLLKNYFDNLQNKRANTSPPPKDPYKSYKSQLVDKSEVQSEFNENVIRSNTKRFNKQLMENQQKKTLPELTIQRSFSQLPVQSPPRDENLLDLPKFGSVSLQDSSVSQSYSLSDSPNIETQKVDPGMRTRKGSNFLKSGFFFEDHLRKINKQVLQDGIRDKLNLAVQNNKNKQMISRKHTLIQNRMSRDIIQNFQLQMKKRSQDTDPTKVSNQGFIDLEKVAQMEHSPAQRFISYNDHFVNLTVRDLVKTGYDVINIAITQDETKAIVILKKINTEYIVRQYILPGAQICQEFLIKGEIIKVMEIVQDSLGQTFCLPYNDSGIFKLRIFNSKNDNIAWLQNINEKLGITSRASSPQGSTIPSINVLFIGDGQLLVNLFDDTETINWHFIYDYHNDVMGQAIQTNMKCSRQNFPVRCFYNEQSDEIYVIYRHGQILTFEDDSSLCFHTDVNECKVKHLNTQKTQTKMGLPNQDQVSVKKLNTQTQPNKREMKTYSQVTIQNLDIIGLEQLQLFENNILIITHQTVILFFKRCSVKSLNSCLIHDDEDDGESQNYWKIYHTIKHSGQIFHRKGYEFLTITTNSKIYFYKFNRETLIPELDSVMFNFMACNQMISGPQNTLMISYQISQENFVIYQRKYLHKYMVKINKTLRKNCLGLTFQKNNSYCISDCQTISFYDQETFQIYHKVSVKEFKNNQSQRQVSQKNIEKFQQLMQSGQSKESEDSLQKSSPGILNNNSILNMKTSPDESRLVLMIGHQAAKGMNKLSRITIYALDHQNSRVKSVEPMYDNVLPPDMQDISIEFEFCNNTDQNPFEESQVIFLIDEFNIYMYNYTNQTIFSYYKFSSELYCQPDYLVFNQHQSIAFVSCRSFDSIFIDLKSKTEIDFDIQCKVNEVQACKYNNGKFYILANRVDRQRGVFLIELDENAVCCEGELRDKLNFLIFETSKLEISGAELYFLGEKENSSQNDSDKEKQAKSVESANSDNRTQLVVCYKTMVVNTLNVIVIALDGDNSDIILKHESFHIWELYFKGYFLSSQYFLILTDEGVSLLNLQRGQETQKQIQDFEKNDVILHSIQECNYLKIRPSNHLHISYSIDKTQVKIKILDSFKNLKKQDAQIVEVYSILLEQPNLQQLLLLQGLFSCSSQSQIALLIEQQPNPYVFYKSYLEIEMTNMVSILSFDSRSIVALLDQKHSSSFSKEYPLFYRFKQDPEHLEQEQDEFKSPFDIALDNNQIQALNVMLRYVVEYQNSYHHAYLFEKNFCMLLVKEISVVPLLNSNILYQSFDYDDWPQTHTNDAREIKPFNDSIFKVGQFYSKVFQELAEDEPNQEIARRSITQKVHKIKYSLNLLTSARNDEYSLMDLLASTDQIEVFDTLPVKDLIEFKWRAYSQNFHFIFAIIHMIYLLTFILYVNFIYLNREFEYKIYFICMMVTCNSVAMIYDVTQLYRSGVVEYYGDVWNYIDVAHIYGGFVNLYIQFASSGNEDIVSQKAKIFMILATMLMLFKTFFYLRIFQSLTHFVIMVGRVVTDMKEFMFFYVLFVTMFSIILGVLGLGSSHMQDGYEDQSQIKHYSTVLYKHIPGMVGNFLLIFRQSLCDFDMSAMMIPQFSTFESYLFWFTFMIIVLITNIVFLNFIIAEVSNSYGRVQKYVQQLILQERASLIHESEQMLDTRLQESVNLFPNYLILREVEE